MEPKKTNDKNNTSAVDTLIKRPTQNATARLAWLLEPNALPTSSWTPLPIAVSIPNAQVIMVAEIPMAATANSPKGAMSKVSIISMDCTSMAFKANGQASIMFFRK